MVILARVQVVDITIDSPSVRTLVRRGAAGIEATPSAAASWPAAAIEAGLLAPCAVAWTQQMPTGGCFLLPAKVGTFSGDSFRLATSQL